MPRLPLLGKLKSNLVDLANRAVSLVRPPRAERVDSGPRPDVLTPELEDALSGAGIRERIDYLLRPAAGTAFMPAAAVRKVLEPRDASPEWVGISRGDTRLMQWHLPHEERAGKPGFHVWLRNWREKRRDAVLVRLAGLPLAAAREVERATKPAGIWRLPPHLTPVPQAGDVPPGRRSVLLIHGFFDRVFGFIFLPLYDPRRRELLEFLHAHYQGRVFGYDHYSVTVDPLANARELVDLLPQGAELDVVCHSRGGLVTRALLEHPEVRPRLDAKGITVHKVVFVGCALQGTELARRDRLAHLLTMFSTLALEQPDQAAQLDEYRKRVMRLLLGVAQAAVSPLVTLPGVATLQPRNPLIEALNGSDQPRMGRYSYVRSSFGAGSGFPGRELARIAGLVFDGRASDLVVPFDGMADLGPKRSDPEPDCRDLGDADDCNHLEYFCFPQVQEFVCDRLARPD